MTLITTGFEKQAQQRPQHPAILLRGSGRSPQSRSYGSLLQAAQQVAAALHSEEKPVEVGLLLSNGVEFLEIFLGVAMAGGRSLVFDPHWSTHQLQQVGQYPLDYLFVEAALVPLLEESCPPELIAKAIVVHQQPGQNWTYQDYQQWCGHSERRPATIAMADELPFYVGFTAGTTGQPKGVVRSHRSWIESFAASQVEFGTQPTDRILVPGALTHSLSLYAVLAGLDAGATVVMLPKFSAKAALTCLQTEAITSLVAVPTLLQTIAKAAALNSQATPHLRQIIAGGARLDPQLGAALSKTFPEAEIVQYLGAIELSFIAVASSREAVPSGSVGRPFHGVSLSIQRLDGSGEADIGEVGWIAVKSAMLSAGYFTAEPEVGYRQVNGWATVGDLGWCDPQGYLYLAGREQDMLISSGVNVYPGAIETVLQSFPEIEQVVVVGVADADRGQAICAAIRWVDRPLSRSEWLRRLQSRLPRSSYPRYTLAVDRFPLTSSGKIDRAALRQWLEQKGIPRQSRATGADSFKPEAD